MTWIKVCFGSARYEVEVNIFKYPSAITDTMPLLCRLCKKSDDWYIDIFEANETHGMLVFEAIQELVQIPVARNDGLPTTVCQECVKKLTDFSDFKVMCIKSLIDLQKLVNKQSEELHRDQIPGEGETNLSYNDKHLQQYGLSLENPDGNPHVFSAKDEYSQCSPKEASVVGSDGDVTGGGEGGFCLMTEEGDWVTSKQNESRQQDKQSLQCLYCDKLFKTHISLVSHVKTVHNVSTRNKDGWKNISPLVEGAGEESDAQCVEEVNDPLVSTETEFHSESSQVVHREESNSFQSLCYLIAEDDQGCSVNPVANGMFESVVNSMQNVGQPELRHLYTSEMQSDSNIDEHQTSKDKFTSVNEKPFSCDECGKRFKLKKSLKVHQQNHAGFFECNFCSMIFNVKSNLITHTNCHRTGELPYVCKVCMMEFHSLTDVKKHSSIHTVRNYECEFCRRKYMNAYTLEVHRRRHTGEKPFQCPVCNKKFSIKNILTRHLKSHIDDTPIEVVM